MAKPLTSNWITEQCKAAGFDKVGIAPATDLEELALFPKWLEQGHAGKLRYMHNPKRCDVRELMPEARSVICCGLGYNTSHPRSTETPLDPARGWVSRYAWGGDYHFIIEKKLEDLRYRIAAHAGENFQCKLYVDTGPVLERVYAKHAGLGWQAKNTCLIDAELGSFFFLGVLVTNLELEPDTPPPDQCGACTLCIDACPTEALATPYVLDARRCISYLTIELRTAIPEDLRQPMGRHVFGCDICQDVCPWNEKSSPSDIPEFQPRPLNGDTLFHPSLETLADLTEEDFRRIFKASPVKRAKWRGLQRNIIVAMGNSGNAKFRPTLERLAGSEDELLAEHARWALDKIYSAREKV